MNVNITFRHTEPSDPLKSYVTDALKQISKHALKPVSADVVFSVEKYRQQVEITLFDSKHTFHASAQSNDMHIAIDMVIAKLGKQLVKQKGKVTNKKSYEKSREGKIVAARGLHDEEHLGKETVKHRKPGW